MIIAHDFIFETVRQICLIARQTLLDQGSHLPTAVLHTMEGMHAIVLPFKDAGQKRALVDFVKEQALMRHAYAVTTVTCARVVDSRTGEEEESLVVATSIQGGRPHFVVQRYLRGPDRHVIAFDEVEEGDLAAMPGQMMIVPPWQDEVRH